MRRPTFYDTSGLVSPGVPAAQPQGQHDEIPYGPDATAEFSQKMNDPAKWVLSSPNETRQGATPSVLLNTIAFKEQTMSTVKRNQLTRVGNGSKPYYGIYQCECGKQKEIYDYSIRRGLTVSCGHYNSENTARRNKENLWGTIHGQVNSPEYAVWEGMIQRCTNPKNPGYKNYGGRGITVCERWLTFENFRADMGERPSLEHSIDRVNNDGNYEPGNCKWSTDSEQLCHTRRSVMITYNDKTQCAVLWARELGINFNTFMNRLRRGWTLERMMTQKVQSRRRAPA